MLDKTNLENIFLYSSNPNSEILFIVVIKIIAPSDCSSNTEHKLQALCIHLSFYLTKSDI